MIKWVIAFLFIGLSAYAQQRTENGSGAFIRTLDRISGQVVDYDMQVGEIVERGNLRVSLKQCRYPEGELNADAFAFLTIQDLRHNTPTFEGWMIASSPALSALEHPRYDVWVLSCSRLN